MGKGNSKRWREREKGKGRRWRKSMGSGNSKRSREREKSPKKIERVRVKKNYLEELSLRKELRRSRTIDEEGDRSKKKPNREKQRCVELKITMNLRRKRGF